MHRYLFRDTFVAQDFITEGLEQGLEQGRQQGRLEAAKNILLETVQHRFPALLPLTERHCDTIIQLANFTTIIVGISTAPDEQQARQIILDASQQ